MKYKKTISPLEHLQLLEQLAQVALGRLLGHDLVHGADDGVALGALGVAGLLDLVGHTDSEANAELNKYTAGGGGKQKDSVSK